MASFEEARANSLRIYFGPGKKEPMEHEIFNFMKQKMRLNPNSLLSMYKEPKEHCVYVKFKTEALLTNALLDLPGSLDFEYNKYESTKVTFSPASTVFKYVRIFNLPPEISDQEISTVMSKFGVIQRMVRERYAPETGFPIWSSVRGIHMEIKQEIPATIHVRNFQARVFYDGLQNKCFLCGSKDHVKVNCPKKSKVNQRMEQDGTLSYSTVAAQPDRWQGKASTSKRVENGGERKMVILNDLFAKPKLQQHSKIPEKPKLPAATKAAEKLIGQDGPSEENRIFPSGDLEDTEMKETTTAETRPGVGDLSSISFVQDAEPKEKHGDGDFQLVTRRKKKEDKRSFSADSKANRQSGTIFIPTTDLSKKQSMETRGRSKMREESKNRSRSRSARGKGSESNGDTGEEGNNKGMGNVERGSEKERGSGEREGTEENLEENL